MGSQFLVQSTLIKFDAAFSKKSLTCYWDLVPRRGVCLFFQTAGHTLSQENLRAWNAMLTGLDAQQIIINNLFVMTIALVGLFTAGTTAALTLLVNGFVAILFLKGFSILEFPWPVRYRFSYLFFEVCALWGSGAMGLQGFSQVFYSLRSLDVVFFTRSLRLLSSFTSFQLC